MTENGKISGENRMEERIKRVNVEELYSTVYIILVIIYSSLIFMEFIVIIIDDFTLVLSILFAMSLLQGIIYFLRHQVSGDENRKKKYRFYTSLLFLFSWSDLVLHVFFRCLLSRHILILLILLDSLKLYYEYLLHEKYTMEISSLIT